MEIRRQEFCSVCAIVYVSLADNRLRFIASVISIQRLILKLLHTLRFKPWNKWVENIQETIVCFCLIINSVTHSGRDIQIGSSYTSKPCDFVEYSLTITDYTFTTDRLLNNAVSYR